MSILTLLLCSWGALAAQTTVGTTSGRVLSRVDPVAPPGAPQTYDVSCKVLFTVGVDGAPTDLAVSGCDEPFSGVTEAAAWQWRFRPSVVEGVAQPYRYSARLAFAKGQGEQVIQTAATTGIVVLNRAQPALRDDFRARARRDGIEVIRCKVRIDVGTDGLPTAVHVIEGPEWLHAALTAAAMQWRFQPVVVEGRPTAFPYIWATTWQAL